MRSIIIVMCALLSLNACKFDSEAPIRVSTNSSIEIEKSVISIPISLEASHIQNLLQKAINENSNGNQLFFESGRDVGNGVTIQTDVKRRADVSIITKNNFIEAHLPLHVDLRADWEFCRRIDIGFASKRVCVKKHEDANAEFTVIAKISPRLTYDYKVEPNLILDYTLDRGAQIKIGPIEINLVTKTREALTKQMAKFQEELTSSLQNKINVKAYVESAWNEIQQPIRIIQNEDLWLVSDISSLHSTPLFTSENAAHIGIGVSGKFSTVFGEPTNDDIPYKPLPNLEQTLPTSAFLLNIPIFIEYTELENKINKILKDYQIEYEGHTAIIKKLTVYGASDGRMVVGANVNLKSSGDWFGTTGWIYLLGHPEYDAKEMHLLVKEVEYDVNTESELLNVASWAASPIIVKKIESFLTFDVKNEIEKYKEIANNNLKEIKIQDVGNLYGNIEAFSIDKVVIQRDAIQIAARASGDMQLKLLKN